MTWTVEPEKRCIVRDVNCNLDKVFEVISFEAKKQLVAKTNSNTMLNLAYDKLTKMYQCVQGKNIFTSKGPDWHINRNK